MSLPVPLAVTLDTARASRRITRLCGGVEFRSVAPGGFASATVSLQHPLVLQPDELEFFADLTITDTRNGETVWQGRVEDLNRSAGSDGQIWGLAGIGPSAHARDRTVQLIYVDTRVDQWRTSFDNNRLSTVGTDTDLAGNSVIKVSAPENAAIDASFNSEMYYDGLFFADQTLSRLVFHWDGGNNDADWLVRVITRPSVGGTPTVVASVGLTTTGGTLTDVIGSDIPDGDSFVFFRLDSTATQTVSPETWAIAIPTVRSRLKDKSGNDLTTGYTSDTIFSSAVVEDLLGRLLPMYDGANANVELAVYHIDQLAYSDGVTPAQVLDDLMAFEPAFYWAAWEKNPATGKYRFEWRGWPTVPRYDATIFDGFDSPASAAELYNAVTVRLVKHSTRRQQVRLTQTVPALTAAGITREGFLDLGDEISSPANATQMATSFLAEHAAPVNAARVTVARPILDRDTGRQVYPWEIRPGHLIRVRGVQPQIDFSNNARNGVTIFRIIGVDVSNDGTASLELDAYTPSVARHLGILNRARDRGRPRRR